MPGHSLERTLVSVACLCALASCVALPDPQDGAPAPKPQESITDYMNITTSLTSLSSGNLSTDGSALAKDIILSKEVVTDSFLETNPILVDAPTTGINATAYDELGDIISEKRSARDLYHKRGVVLSNDLITEFINGSSGNGYRITLPAGTCASTVVAASAPDPATGEILTDWTLGAWFYAIQRTHNTQAGWVAYLRKGAEDNMAAMTQYIDCSTPPAGKKRKQKRATRRTTLNERMNGGATSAAANDDVGSSTGPGTTAWYAAQEAAAAERAASAAAAGAGAGAAGAGAAGAGAAGAGAAGAAAAGAAAAAAAPAPAPAERVRQRQQFAWGNGWWTATFLATVPGFGLTFGGLAGTLSAANGHHISTTLEAALITLVGFLTAVTANILYRLDVTAAFGRFEIRLVALFNLVASIITSHINTCFSGQHLANAIAAYRARYRPPGEGGVTSGVGNQATNPNDNAPSNEPHPPATDPSSSNSNTVAPSNEQQPPTTDPQSSTNATMDPSSSNNNGGFQPATSSIDNLYDWAPDQAAIPGVAEGAEIEMMNLC
ncbi:MAG: hypothetical protein M1828_002916 [Chrysothrix sp. TS-e1954]|nr:MAG: hypothetical protein M1828_002916 [Chrysothrix sp. TS-e1954]